MKKIYDESYLEINSNNYIYHKHYKFIFIHDYHITDGLINNYTIVKERFNIKIKNFREMLSNDNTCIFIVFTANVNELEISNMIELLSIKKQKFHVMIFTNNTFDVSYSSPHVTITPLINSYENWWNMNKIPKIELYKEIYDKFIHNLMLANIVHHYPKTFEETQYGK